MFEIKNKIEIGGLRTKPADYSNQAVYDRMSCGKMELETSAAQFISQYKKDKRGYLIIPTKDLIEL